MTETENLSVTPVHRLGAHLYAAAIAAILEDDMATRSGCRVSLAAWFMLTVTAWARFVPDQVLVENWAWLNAGVVALAVTLIVCLDRLQPARTTSQVLAEATDRLGRS